MTARSSASSVQSGALARSARLAPARDAGQELLRLLVEAGDLVVAHQRLGLLQELVVAPAALVLELAQLGLELRGVLPGQRRAARPPPRPPPPRSRPCCIAACAVRRRHARRGQRDQQQPPPTSTTPAALPVPPHLRPAPTHRPDGAAAQGAGRARHACKPALQSGVSECRPELVGLGEAARRQPARLGALADPVPAAPTTAA